MCRELSISKIMVYLFIKLSFFLQRKEKTANELRTHLQLILSASTNSDKILENGASIKGEEEDGDEETDNEVGELSGYDCNCDEYGARNGFCRCYKRLP